MDTPPATDRFVGIDVSKDRVDVHVSPDATAFACTAGEGATAPALNRRSPQTTLQRSSRPLSFKTVAPLVYFALPAAFWRSAGLRPRWAVDRSAPRLGL